MVCPKCGSQNVNIQLVSTSRLRKKRHGVAFWLYWLCFGWLVDVLLWIFLTIPKLIFTIFAPKKYELQTTHSSVCICQNCGFTFTPTHVAPASAPPAAPAAPSSGAVHLVRTQTTDPAVLTLNEYVVMDTETTGLNPEPSTVRRISLLT